MFLTFAGIDFEWPGLYAFYSTCICRSLRAGLFFYIAIGASKNEDGITDSIKSRRYMCGKEMFRKFNSSSGDQFGGRAYSS